MAQARITKQAVDQAQQATKLLGKPTRLYDPDLKGFGFTAAVSGGGSYFVEYRLASIGPHRTRFAFGKAGVMTPDAARKQAVQLLGLIAQGKDPQAAKQSRDEQARGLKFGELCQLFFDYRDDGDSRYWRDLRARYRLHIPAVLNARPAALVTRADLRCMLDVARAKSPSTERWLHAPLRGIFAWGVERGLVPENPALGLSKPERWEDRDRVLTQAELAAVWHTAGAIPYPFGPFYRLLILTGCRRNEVAEMEWRELDLDGALWAIPGARTKNGKAHALELPQAAVALLSSLQRGASAYVFTTTGRAPVSGFSMAKVLLDRALAGAVEDWRLHDLRRTFATHHAEYLGTDETIIERLLNHATAMSGVKGVYQRQRYGDKRRAAMEAWGRYVETLTPPTSASYLKAAE